ncbi:uncharacterized protein LOC132198737 [Neocloeon triangulifer]|uniref:uncharacterized protein LOC132198737 n=1 Tax=Neocloeon triangulifer TaxID=2078957 RepID=UPI00286F1EA1|nr:uncharacterized protein LOC132198737 [Neocloeon triangulifer]
MSKSCNKSHALLPQLDELCESPRLLGVDPIVRYFPPLKINGLADDKNSKPTTPYFNKNLSKMNAEYEDSDDDVCFGPITIKELRKASVLMRTMRERESVAPKTFLEALEEQGATSNTELLSDETEAETSAPPPSPEKAQPERELVVQEFSLEESHFSGCNLSGLNLSFESGITGPAAPVETKEATGTSDGLYTLAFISDLAKKLDIKEEPVTPAKVAELVRPIYSPISPADGETSQYEDAEMAKEPLEHSTIALWHDAESERKDHLDLDRSAKKRISDVSLLSNETEVLDTTTDDKNDTAELLNDTIEEMEKLLSMDVDYFQKQKEQDDVVEIQKEAEDMSGENSSFFAPRQPKLPIQEMLEEYAIPRSPVLSVQPKPAKKFFPTPNAFKTPQAAKAPTTDRCNSAGSNSKVDPARKVHVSTPFRVPKSNEARSADFKLKPGSDTKPKLPANFMPYKLQQPLSSRLPKPVRAFQNITSPVGQYIHGPVVAPMIANAKPTSSPRVVGKLFNGGTPNKLTPAKAELENLNPNSALPFVNYDSSSSIKVVEHKEVSQKALPNKIKKLLPSPGSVVLKHTGRVNIPETQDGRHEVSIMVSQDAFHTNDM